MTLPYLTAEAPGIGGQIKQRPEDFVVHELPLYEPSGQGEHVYCEIRKTGLSTFEAVDRLAAALGVDRRQIGYAGMKDARAVTQQVLSIWGTTPQAVQAAQVPNLSILWAQRHANKLRLGHLAGNRFLIKLREVSATDVVRIAPVVELLGRRGLPNYFGQQRFGRRQDNAALGAALLRGDDRQLVTLMLGHPDPQVDDAQAIGARKAFDENDWPKAMRLYPRHCGMERRALARLMKRGDFGASARAIDQRLRRLWISSLQSELFNQVLARRIQTLDQLQDGDLAWKHDSGAVFHVEQAAVEQPRCQSFEISPTGPLVGYRMSLPSAAPLAVEQEAMASAQLEPAHFRQAGRHKVKGARRPLRVPVGDLEMAGGVDEHGPFVSLAFSLPPGAYATSLLREISKHDHLE